MNTENYGKNLSALKKCSRIYNAVCIIYVLSCVLYAVAMTFLMLLTVSGDVLYLFFDGLVCKGALLFFGYMGAYKKSNMYAAIAPAAAMLNIVLPSLFYSIGNYVDMFIGSAVGGFSVNVMYLIMSAVLAALTILANKKYHWLEQQEGFPHFSERFDQQSSGVPKYGLTIEQRAEQLKKTARSDMEALDISVTAAPKQSESESSGYMDSI